MSNSNESTPSPQEEPVAEAMRNVPRAFQPDRAEPGYATAIHFIIDGAFSYTLIVAEGIAEMSRGLSGAPDTTLKTDRNTLMGLLDGTLDAAAAFLEGKLVIDELGPIMKFVAYFDFSRLREIAPTDPTTPSASAPEKLEQAITRCVHAVASIDPTRAASAIEDAVLQSGLYPYLPWQLGEFPHHLHDACGKGVGLWQYPRQFSKYIECASRRRPIARYAEIGVAAGGTFMFTTEYLRRFHGLVKSYAVDLAAPGKVCYLPGASPFDGILDHYLHQHSDVVFLQGDAALLAARLEREGTKLDLLLIDGDHSYEGARRDFEVLRAHASMIALHDIASDPFPGVRKLWEELKALPDYDAAEFVDQYDNVQGRFLGIGLLMSRDA